MKSRIIAFITAGAVAATTLTAPAKADPANDLLRLAIGAAVIGAIVHGANQNNQPQVKVTRGYNDKKKKKRHAHGKNHKPRQCLVRKWTDHGWKKRYDRNCMAHYGWHRHSGNGWHTHNRHAHR